MRAIPDILCTLGLAGLFPLLWRGRRPVVGTTLEGAWWWLTAATLLWSAAWVTTVLTSAVAPAVADQLWYAAAVSMLCPLVAVLGARRPVTRVWTWFVIIPLVLVLSIPLITAWSGGLPFDRLQLETPPLLGYLLVLVMGAGNYFGTRFTLASLLLAVSLVLLVVPISSAAPATLAAPETARLWATALLVAAGLAAWRESRRPAIAESPIDGLWLDFRDYFGIVWAKRFQDRINQTAASENWPARLELPGLVAAGGSEPFRPETVPAPVEHAFRWLLRRFVDSPWIDARLKGPADSTEDTAAGGEG